jgi:RNA polymerase-interacting CarD/CdnL/TRCF family regulator
MTDYQEMIDWFKQQDLTDTERQLLEVNEKLYNHEMEIVHNCGKQGLQDMYNIHCFYRGLKGLLFGKTTIQIA